MKLTTNTLAARRSIGAALGLAALIGVAPAQAQTAAPAAPATPAPPANWSDSIKFGVQIQAGITANGDAPKTNFGSLFNDKANSPLINQGLMTLSRVIDPAATGWEVGFKLQGMYGSDARYTKLLGVLDKVKHDRYQPDLVEANITVHAPVLTEGGIDFKAGEYTTPLGFETIDPSTNPFYSHSYIFNFGLPLKHTGAIATVHATSMLDVIAGVDTGINTTFGGGDNNTAMGGIVGFGLNLMDGAVTVLALSHIGPENPKRTVPNADKYLRYVNDAFLTWKATEKLTLTTELNFIHDDFAKASAWGIAQYGAYVLGEQTTLNGRLEVFGDSKGFFVGSFPGNSDFVNAELGLPATVLGGTHTTYGAATVGITYKPAPVGPLASLMLRPELRVDTALDKTKPFNGGKSGSAVMISMDAILGF